MLVQQEDFTGTSPEQDKKDQYADEVPVETTNEVPEDVNSVEQLDLVPDTYLSDDPKRPLKYEVNGAVHKFALKPLFYSVIFILLVEAIERLSYYGVSYTATSYFTGHYANQTGYPDWSPALGSVEASSWVSISTSIAYATPFVGAILADTLLGGYYTILLGASVFYLPGLLLIALTAYPYLLGSTFPTTVLAVGFIGLYSIGAGMIKSVVNVFGAQQYHPIVQKQLIDRYYIKFYMCINIGALVGGISIPIVVQSDMFAAYMIPVCGLFLCLVIFLMGTPRYVRYKPEGRDTVNTLKACGGSLLHCPPSLTKEEAVYGKDFIQNVKMLLAVVPITSLTICFNMAYAQMSTTFIVQGNAMAPAVVIDASMMQNVDAISVLLSGWLIGSYFYPFLAKRGIELHVTTKFAIGSLLAALAILCGVIVDYQLHSQYEKDGTQLSILYQIPQYLLIGTGEIFTISAAYAAAFQVAPSSQKALASAINLFLIGSVPNLISTAILNGCKQWAFATPSGDTDLKTIQQYASAHVYRFFWVLFGICLAGAVISVLPPVRRGVKAIEAKAREMHEKKAGVADAKEANGSTCASV